MTVSNVFGLNFLQPTGDGGSTPIVGDYEPQSQMWGGIVTAQAAGGCANECYTCCGNETYTTSSTAEWTSWTTSASTDVSTGGSGRPDYESDDSTDSGYESDVQFD